MADKRLFKIYPRVLNRFRNWSERGSSVGHRFGLSKLGVFQGFLFSQMSREEAVNYIGRLKGELGDFGYEALVERFAEEDATPPPAPEPPAEQPAKPEPSPQMELPLFLTESAVKEEALRLLGFTKTVDKTHPAAAASAAWKAAHKMDFMLFDQLKERLGEMAVPFSAKYDGELVCLWFDGQEAVVVTHKGTVRSDLPATDEATEYLKRHYKRAVLMGEFYAVDEKGRPISYMRAAHTLRDPRAGDDDQIRIAVFDIVELDGKSYEDIPIAQKMAIVNQIFKGAQHIQPVFNQLGTIRNIEAFWNELDERGLEGVVVHMPDKTIIKSKPVMSFDLVIVAVSKSPALPGRIGAILTSFIDKEGRFRLNGHVGTGLTDEQRVELLEWAKSIAVREDEDHIWVDPARSHVIEVEAVEVKPQEQPTYVFKGGHYVEVENQMSGTLRFPVVKQFRTDKDPKYPDVRVEQLPFKTSSSQLRQGMHIKTITGHTGKVIRLVERSGDSGLDYDVAVDWDVPVWGIKVSEVHPDDIVEIIE